MERTSAKVSNFILRGWALDLLQLARPTLGRSRRVAKTVMAALDRYEGRPYDGPASLVVSQPTNLREQAFMDSRPYLGWDDLIDPNRITLLRLASGHLDMVKGKPGEVLAAFIDERIDAAQARA